MHQNTEQKKREKQRNRGEYWRRSTNSSIWSELNVRKNVAETDKTCEHTATSQCFLLLFFPSFFRPFLHFALFQSNAIYLKHHLAKYQVKCVQYCSQTCNSICRCLFQALCLPPLKHSYCFVCNFAFSLFFLAFPTLSLLPSVDRHRQKKVTQDELML